MNRNDNAEAAGEISQRRAWAWRMAVLWAFALVVRVLYIRTVDNSSIGSWGDQGGDIALNLLEGRGYVTSYGFIRDLQSFRVPVLPLTLLALWSLFGLNFLIPKLAMAIVSAFTCVLLALLGRRLFNERAGLWAGIAAALCTSLIRWTGTLGAETLATFFLVAGVWLLCDPPARFAPTFRFTPAAICLARHCSR